MPEELPICLRPMNLKHRLVDPHNNNNNSHHHHHSSSLSHPAVGPNNKDLYDDDHERPLLDTTEAESLDLSHLSSASGGGRGATEVGGGGAAGGGGELAVNSPESLLSSPGRPQPVKFDFNAVDAVKGS